MAEILSIGMVLFPGMTQLDLTGPYEVFTRIPNARVTLIAQTLEPVPSEHGLAIMPDATFDSAPVSGILFVPGGPGVNPLMEDEPFLDFLCKQSQQAHYITSVCTGALLLGAAGLLKGYKAATHWLSMDLLPLFGAEPVYERVVIDRNRITGGGVTAGIDFALAVAAHLCGAEVAQAIQLSMEYNPAPPFQSGSPEQADPHIIELVTKRSQVTQAARREIAERIQINLADKGS